MSASEEIEGERREERDVIGAAFACSLHLFQLFVRSFVTQSIASILRALVKTYQLYMCTLTRKLFCVESSLFFGRFVNYGFN